ncbi:TPA: hypothetical protein EYP38_05625 [Candidatus Micrarchaeota archaeon]|nr:hypothetical protein [Candidatus Micrarchaeota archaeon]
MVESVTLEFLSSVFRGVSYESIGRVMFDVGLLILLVLFFTGMVMGGMRLVKLMALMTPRQFIILLAGIASVMVIVGGALASLS